MRTGCSIAFFLNPKKAPTNVKGTETPNHKANKATKVKNGIAAEESLYQRTKFITKKWAKTILKMIRKQFFTYLIEWFWDSREGRIKKFIV